MLIHLRPEALLGENPKEESGYRTLHQIPSLSFPSLVSLATMKKQPKNVRDKAKRGDAKNKRICLPITIMIGDKNTVQIAKIE
jgi:hypothetical protein